MVVGCRVVSALAVSHDGTPIGVCGQCHWARTERSKRIKKRFRSMQTETRHSVELLQEVDERFVRDAPRVEPCLHQHLEPVESYHGLVRMRIMAGSASAPTTSVELAINPEGQISTKSDGH